MYIYDIEVQYQTNTTKQNRESITVNYTIYDTI